MFHPKHTNLIVSIIMSGFMALFMTLVITIINTGIDEMLWLRWAIAFVTAWPLALGAMLIFRPIALKLAKGLVKTVEQKPSN